MMSKILKIDTDYFVENATRYVFIDGLACQHLNSCYDILQRQLSIPDYFGRNLDALEEVLGDLDWIKEDKIKIIISNLAILLAKDKGKKDGFLDILNTCSNDKLEIIYLGIGTS
jgi:hypothetical protein